MAVGTDPIGRVLANLVTLRRIGNTIHADGRALLDALFEQLAADLARIDPTGPALEKWRKYRTEQFIEGVETRLAVAIPDWRKTVRAGLAVGGRMQGEWAVGTIVASLGVEVAEGVVRATPITQALAKAILDTDPFGGSGSSYTLSEWAASLRVKTRRAVVAQVRTGMLFEEGIPEMARRLQSVYAATARDAEAIVRTGVTFISNEAHLRTYRENAEAVEGVEYSATLDARTTEICMSLDGTVWPLGSPKIIIPGLHTHTACRSQLVPVPAYEKFGLEPPPDGFRQARDLRGITAADLREPVATRRATGKLGKSSLVSSRTTAESWLKSQSKAVQDHMLGKGKAQLFRDGKINLRDLINDDMTIRPLSELR